MSPSRSTPNRVPVHALYVGVFLIAFVHRFIPVLRGGGLAGIMGYDDGVYYAAAVALVHGAMPYQDFLLLHPPGALLVLAPVAALGRMAGEVAGWEAARLLWMLMGCVSSVLVVRIVWPLGTAAAAISGYAYAVFPGAVLVERTTLLEGLANLCLAAALAILVPHLPVRRRGPVGPRVQFDDTSPSSWMPLAAAGALLGFATTVKIWGVLPLVVVCGYAVLTAGLRRALVVSAGAVVTMVAVCLPFFAVAPSAMWRMVVLDQVARDRGGVDAGMVRRFAEVLTMERVPPGPSSVVVAVVGFVGLVLVCLLAWSCRSLRIAVPLLLTTLIGLSVSPIFFPHYVGVLGVPAALVLGAAVARVASSVTPRPVMRIAVAVVGSFVVAVDLLALSMIRSGEAVPASELAGVTGPATGCITADDPNTLLALAVFGRNVSRGCEVVVDLGGYSHDLSRETASPRRRNAEWQLVVLRYLGSGQYALVTRFSAENGLSPSTAAKVESWPVRVRIGGYALRQPTR